MITAEFKSFIEMVEFAKALVGTVSGAGAAPVVHNVTFSGPETSTPLVPVVQSAATPMPQHPVAAPTVAPVAQVSQAPVQMTAPVQTVTTSYSLDDLARAAMTLMDSGKQDGLLGLLKSFGVEALPALPPAQYGAFATALRGMGAQI